MDFFLHDYYSYRIVLLLGCGEIFSDEKLYNLESSTEIISLLKS
jgi:hypothetical protein